MTGVSEAPHIPVLLDEVVAALAPAPGETMVDATFGAGGYARALLACPGDADLLSLYARVIWEARQEKDRAEAYFERAVQAAPDDW